MKKFLSIILTLILVLTMSAGIVMAEPTEATEQTEVAEETTAPQIPEDFDESSIVQYIVYNFSDIENPTVSQGYTATDATLDYLKTQQQSAGQTIEDTKYGDTRLLLLGETVMTLDGVNDTGVLSMKDEGFLADKYYVGAPFGTFENYASTRGEGTTIVGIVMNFGNALVSAKGAKVSDGIIVKNIVVGEQNAFLVTAYSINWINVLILAMCLIVLILLVVIVALTMKKKKAIKIAEETSEFVSEDALFDTLVTETAEEVEEVTEIDEEVNEVAEEIEETTETEEK